MARHSRQQCKLGWVIYVETFLAVAAFSYISMLCVDGAAEEDAMVAPLTAAFPSATFAKLVASEAPEAAPASAMVREQPREAPAEKPRCEKLPAFTTTFVIAFMAGGFMNVERIQGLPIP